MARLRAEEGRAGRRRRSRRRRRSASRARRSRADDVARERARVRQTARTAASAARHTWSGVERGDRVESDAVGVRRWAGYPSAVPILEDLDGDEGRAEQQRRDHQRRAAVPPSARVRARRAPGCRWRRAGSRAAISASSELGRRLGPVSCSAPT